MSERNYRDAHDALQSTSAKAAEWRSMATRAIAKAKGERSSYYPACANGPCAGGRKVCPSPQACRLSADHTMPFGVPWPPLVRLGVIAAILFGVACVIGSLR